MKTEIQSNGLITTGDSTCAGYIFNFQGHGAFDPTGKIKVGDLELNQAQIEAHNKILGEAEWRATIKAGRANVTKHNRCNLKDKNLLCRISAQWAFKTKWTPDPIEILWAIARDGDALESTFEDWASEYGYDSDSRKAEKIYRACQDGALRLKKILSPEHIETLRNLDL